MKSITLVLSTILTLCQQSPTLQNEASLLSTKNNDLVPLYLMHPNFLFTSATNRDVLDYLTKNGFQQKTTLGFVAKNNVDCNGKASLIPVYRFKNEHTQNYILSTNQSLPTGTTVSYSTYVVAFYVSPTLNEHCGRTLPLHSYWVQNHYVYTMMDKTSADEILVEIEGGEYKGIVCHIWLNDDPSMPTTTVSTKAIPTTTKSTTTVPTTTLSPRKQENPARSTNSACDFSNPNKRNYGVFEGVTLQQCESMGYCFDNSIYDVPWCLKSQRKLNSNRCDFRNHQKRVEGGFSGITAKECVTRGHCFDDSTPNIISCFKYNIETA